MKNTMSETEFYILKYLWTRETPATFAEIMTHFSEEGKEWKKQTVNTFLTRLSAKGFVNIDKSGKRAIYTPTVNLKEFYENYAKEVVDESYNGSILEFIRAYSAGHKLDETEKSELASFIQNF